MSLKHVLGVSVSVATSKDFCCVKLYLLFSKPAWVQCNISAFVGWLVLTSSPFQNLQNLALKSELDKFLWPVLSNIAYKHGKQNSSRDS